MQNMTATYSAVKFGVFFVIHPTFEKRSSFRVQTLGIYRSVKTECDNTYRSKLAENMAQWHSLVYTQ